jgi:hypothetical protein
MITGIENRAITGGEEFQSELQRAKGKKKTDPLTLAERIQAARDLTAPLRSAELHCGHCWGNGRDAAIKAIEEAQG